MLFRNSQDSLFTAGQSVCGQLPSYGTGRTGGGRVLQYLVEMQRYEVVAVTLFVIRYLVGQVGCGWSVAMVQYLHVYYSSTTRETRAKSTQPVSMDMDTVKIMTKSYIS